MSLDGVYDPNNVFAKIIAGEMPCHTVMDDDVAVAFMDLYPQSMGHTLVVPKNAGRNLLDTDDAVLSTLFPRVKRVAAAVRTAFEPDGIVITQFNGQPAGQTVYHLHVHIIPRYENLPMGRHSETGEADAETLAAQAEKVKAALAA